MKKKQAAEKPDRHKKKGKTKPGLTFVEFHEEDVIRHPLVGRIVQAYERDIRKS